MYYICISESKSTCIPEERARNNPSNPTYCGPSAGSELETKAVSAELNRIGSSVVALVSLHSYGKMWLIPWGNHVDYSEKNVCERTEDHDELVGLCAIGIHTHPTPTHKHTQAHLHLYLHGVGVGVGVGYTYTHTCKYTHIAYLHHT